MKIVIMKTYYGGEVETSFSDGEFWYNGVSLGKHLPTARKKLAELTHNCFYELPYIPREDRSVEKSINRHLRKDKTKFDFLTSIGYYE